MGKKIVCHCEDVDADEIASALKQGYGDLETLKRFTGIGTGKCQGKCCLLQTVRILASLSPETSRREGPQAPAGHAAVAADPRRIHLPTIRPPVLPLRIDDIIEAGEEDS